MGKGNHVVLEEQGQGEPQDAKELLGWKKMVSQSCGSGWAPPPMWNTPKDFSQGRQEDPSLAAGKDDSKGKAWCGSMGGGGCSPPRRQQRYFFVATVIWAKLPVVFIGLKWKGCLETPNEQGAGWEAAPT